MPNISYNNKNGKHIVNESELKFSNLLETTYCLLKAYFLWFYIKSIRTLKIDIFINLVKKVIYNVKAKINNNSSQRKNLLQWIRSKLREPLVVNNFREDWKNGILLCALMEGVVPGSCPRYDLLNPEQEIENLNLGLSLIKKHLNIDSPIESQEIHDCEEEAKFVYLLSRVKFESMKILMKSLIRRSIIDQKDSFGNNHKMFESLFSDQKACFAKGMGLILGVRTRKARFNIFCKPTPKLNLIIEIMGPNNSMCSERIAIFNPKKRFSADVVTTSLIEHFIHKNKSENTLKIPLFYEVFSNKIVVTYIPLMKGIHKLSIIWQGQHILNSPYTVKVEECYNEPIKDMKQTTGSTSPTKFVPGLQYPVNALNRKDSFSLDECATVIGRKVLKRTVIVNGIQQSFDNFNKCIVRDIYKIESNDNAINNAKNSNNQVFNDLYHLTQDSNNFTKNKYKYVYQR
ncbi:uncharacterized protein LOC128962470 [Oppia nitens]|uniref:uncharacterized protein LOC128962470 n=1 Tax=Oppia nitens TaxID=1686743 RepID=UPI0023DC68C2|nr:uncharacterized protein LOC128962470 [Oppia nitens]